MTAATSPEAVTSRTGCCARWARSLCALGRPVVTICESGARAAIAASLLAREGIDARPVLNGGITEWEERGGQTVEFRCCGS